MIIRYPTSFYKGQLNKNITWTISTDEPRSSGNFFSQLPISSMRSGGRHVDNAELSFGEKIYTVSINPSASIGSGLGARNVGDIIEFGDEDIIQRRTTNDIDTAHLGQIEIDQTTNGLVRDAKTKFNALVRDRAVKQKQSMSINSDISKKNKELSDINNLIKVALIVYGEESDDYKNLVEKKEEISNLISEMRAQVISINSEVADFDSKIKILSGVVQ